ncbi:hypothetical protein, partial [Mesorhizobium sp.]|uniref:hypothetical protein n=1 Tax=Mesorhizobium sp. TaxID=1871066 RepID=UPI0025811A0D
PSALPGISPARGEIGSFVDGACRGDEQRRPEAICPAPSLALIARSQLPQLLDSHRPVPDNTSSSTESL